VSRDPLAVAQHEAAHVIVGLALGLRLRRVTVKPERVKGVGLLLGNTVFDARCGSVEAWSLTYAAGSAWEKRHGDWRHAWLDEARLRERNVRGRGLAALEHAAWCVLHRASGAHARLTRKLLDAGELSGHEVQALLGGESWNEI
jgi:hypothetical protein